MGGVPLGTLGAGSEAAPFKAGHAWFGATEAVP